MKILFHHRTQRALVEGVHITGVVNGLRKLGHDVVEVALLKKESAPASAPSAPDKKKSSNLKSLFKWLAKNMPNKLFRTAEIFYNAWALVACARAVLREKPDAIYERYAYFAFAGVLCGKILKTPVILEVNIITEMSDTRELELASIAAMIEKWVLKNASAIIVVSDYLKSSMVSMGVDGRVIHVQPNAFSSEVAPIEQNMDALIKSDGPDKVVIGFIGGLGKWYKLPSLVESFRNLKKKYENIHLVFIGDGSLRGLLEEMAGDFGLEDSVVFCGRVSQKEALGYLQKIDIGVIPSTNLWGSPMKLFEYMGMGKPVVAPDIGVITSVMKDGEHGKIFKYNDFEDFENALQTLVNDPEKRRLMGKQAREHILKYHTWANVAQNTSDVITAARDRGR